MNKLETSKEVNVVFLSSTSLNALIPSFPIALSVDDFVLKVSKGFSRAEIVLNSFNLQLSRSRSSNVVLTVSACAIAFAPSLSILVSVCNIACDSLIQSVVIVSYL